MITVFTPTFNRVYIIDKLYQSLLSQTNKDFEWLVIDDGSTDGTKEYFSKITSNSNPFKITYIVQKNGGKHRAINKGVQLAKGNLFFIVDSDDYLTDDAIEKLIEWEFNLDDTKKWAGISGIKGHSINTPVGGNGNGELYIDAKNTDREKLNLMGDKAEAYFTEVLRKYPFPEFEGENFITEEVVWNMIAHDGYYIRWYKDIIYICNYLEDGLSKNIMTKYRNNPNGVLYWAKIQLLAFPKNLKKRMAAVNFYYELAREKGMKINKIASELNVSKFFCRVSHIAAKIKRLFR